MTKLAEHAGWLEAVGPSPRLDQGLCMGVRTGSDLLAAFNDALDSIKADGALNALIRRWPGADAATFGRQLAAGLGERSRSPGPRALPPVAYW